MSELKAFIARKIDDGSCDPVPCIEVYLKSEADKVIAEKEREIALLKERICNGDVSRLTWIDDCIAKDKEIAELKKQVHDYGQGLYVMQARAEKEIEHAKYKRCLAMAKWCHNESLWWYSKGYGFEKYDKFWEKWEKRWLKIAEQFKEAK